METKVTMEEFTMLFASCGYTVMDVWEGQNFYFVDVKEQAIEIRDLRLLTIKGLTLFSIGKGVNDLVEVEYYKGTLR